MSEVLFAQSDATDPLPLPSESVDCIFTSPGYWNQRDYECENQIGEEPDYDCLRWAIGENCGLCYTCRIRSVVRDVARVLRKKGVFFLNIGETYLNRKQLGVPWRIALAIQEDGLFLLRKSIIWDKVTPVPDGVANRPSSSHEYIFMFTRIPTGYYWDKNGVREKPAGYIRKGGKATYTANGFTSNGTGKSTLHQMNPNGRNILDIWRIPQDRNMDNSHPAPWPVSLVERMLKLGCPKDGLAADIFVGSGNSAIAAKNLGIKFVGLDLSYSFLDEAMVRLALKSKRAVQKPAQSINDLPLFTQREIVNDPKSD